jgi:class 3 adenylate cyclase/tetratricopeptide (TPR) repeat protein
MLNATAVLTFLIADLRGYTQFTEEQGDEAAAQLAARFAAVAGSAVGEYGGDVVELRGDEVLAVFRSARQALRCASELQAKWAEETAAVEPAIPGVGIGVDAGEAVPVQTGYRGAALNMAARLCGLARPGEILATESVTHLAHRVPGLTYVDRGHWRVKGITEQVRVMAVSPEQSRPEPPELPARRDGKGLDVQVLPVGAYLGALPAGTLVGRESEMERLRVAIQDGLTGAGKIILLSGEPGAGKTRLAQETTRLLNDQGFLIAAGRCYEEEQAVPYYPFREALATIHHNCSPTLRMEILRRWPDILRLLPQETLVASPVGATYRNEDVEEQQRFFWSVCALLAAAALERPLAVLFDDLQWADASTLRLLQYIARHDRPSPIFLLGTYRDVEVGRQHPLERMLRDLQREGLAERTDVGRLSRDATGELVAATIGGGRIPDHVRDLLYERTDGNPFFVRQVVQALAEQGVLAGVDGRWQAERLDEMAVPESIRSVIGQRLSRLPEAAQQILRVASVLGQEFSFAHLADTAESTEGELETALEQALATGLVRERPDDGYAFDHALTQQTLYAELSARKRRRLHLRAGAALDQLPERRRTARAAELAWHFLQADDPARALPHTLLAGDQANFIYARSEAELQYRTAVELATEIGDRRQEAAAEEKLGQLLFEIGQPLQAIPVLERAAVVYRELGDREAEGRTIAQLGLAHFTAGSAPVGLVRVQEAVDERASAGSSPSLAALYDALATLLQFTDGRDKMRTVVERGQEIARECGDTRLALRLEIRRAAILGSLGLLHESRNILERLIPEVEESGDLLSLTRATGNLVGLACQLGDVPAAETYARRLLEIGKTSGHTVSVLMAVEGLGQAAFCRGDWDQALAYFEEGCSIYERTGAHFYREVQVGVLFLRMLRGDEAAYAKTKAWEDRSPAQHLGVQKMLAEVELLLGHPDAAIARLQPLFDLPDVSERHLARVTSARARLQLSPGAPAAREAEETARAAVADPLVQEFKMFRYDPMLLLAQALSAQDRWDEAAKAFQHALDYTLAPYFPYMRAIVQREYGRQAARFGQAGEAHRLLGEALETFRRLGAGFDLRETERVLGAIDGISTGTG